MWATNVVRAELAIEMMVWVGLGSGVHSMLGAGPVAMAVAVLLSLSAAVLIGRGFLLQRPMLVNQTVISAILILAFPRGGFGTERLSDALIGGGIAVFFSIVVFPKDPLAVLRDARVEVLTQVHDILTQSRSHTGDSGWALSVAAQLHRGPARQAEARSGADKQAARLSLLAGSVLHLAHAVIETDEPLAEPINGAIGDLADDEPTPAAAHTVSARSHPMAVPPTGAALLAAAIDPCIDELDRVIELAPR